MLDREDFEFPVTSARFRGPAERAFDKVFSPSKGGGRIERRPGLEKSKRGGAESFILRKGRKPVDGRLRVARHPRIHEVWLRFGSGACRQLEDGIRIISATFAE
jgi:hypothetical protein